MATDKDYLTTGVYNFEASEPTQESLDLDWNFKTPDDFWSSPDVIEMGTINFQECPDRFHVTFFNDTEEVIKIDLEHKTVTIAEGFSADEAAHVFWQRVMEFAGEYIPEVRAQGTQPAEDVMSDTDFKIHFTDDNHLAVSWTSDPSETVTLPESDSVGLFADVDFAPSFDLKWSDIELSWHDAPKDDKSEEKTAYERAMKVLK